MSDDTRQVRVEAALTAYYLHYKRIARYPSNRITWAECVERYPDDAADERGAIAAALDAADAAAAPAVGVTVEQMEQLQQLGRPINTPIIVSVSLHDVMAVLSFLYDEHGLHLPLAVQNAHDRMMESAYAVARERAALLTAQPDSAPDDVDWKSWGKHIREYRMNQRVSMYDMAKLLGVTSAQYCSMELAELTPNVEQRSIIEQRLGIGDTMTAQPEPGTHDDAGQPATEGGVRG